MTWERAIQSTLRHAVLTTAERLESLTLGTVEQKHEASLADSIPFFLHGARSVKVARPSVVSHACAQAAKYLSMLLSLNGSVSLYMAHGGTNFGLWSGANGGGSSFQPSITRFEHTHTYSHTQTDRQTYHGCLSDIPVWLGGCVIYVYAYSHMCFWICLSLLLCT